jgi:hypothetical protein
LLPIIGQSLGNQHAAIISSMLYNTEFFNRIGQKQTFRPINSANGVAKRQRVQEDRCEHDRNKNPMNNPISREG